MCSYVMLQVFMFKVSCLYQRGFIFSCWQLHARVSEVDTLLFEVRCLEVKHSMLAGWSLTPNSSPEATVRTHYYGHPYEIHAY